MASEGDERFGQQVNNISADIRSYIKTQVKLLALTASEHYSKFASKMVFKGACVFLLLIAFLFLLIALAEFIGALLESQPLGYVIVAGLLIIIGGTLLKLKPKSVSQKIKRELENGILWLIDEYDVKTDQPARTDHADKILKENNNDGAK